MTGKELIDEILKLAMKSQTVYPVEPQAIYVHINRAIEEVNRLSPILGTVSILHYPITPTVYHKGIMVHRGEEDIEINASGIRSLAFAVSGTGEAYLSGKNGRRMHRFEWTDATSFEVQKCFVLNALGVEEADVTLTFTGKHSYMIRDVSFYAYTVSDLIEDVKPYAPSVKYDMTGTELAGGRFMDFALLPIRYADEELNAPTDYRIEGSCVYIPANRPGVYDVSFYKRPLKVDAENVNFEIEVDARLTDLLALRAAYYFYMVTDREVAERCNAEYLRLQSVVMSTMHKVRTPVKFRNARRW